MNLNGRTLLELISMTLDVNRLELGRVAVSMSRFHLGELLGEIEREVETRIDASRVLVAWPNQAASLPELRSDRGKLKIVLRNLIDNAIKFTTRGSVTVAVNLKKSWADISVSDTGIGIPEDDIARIFEIFQQVRNESIPMSSGVGLGLYLVRRYCDLLGARVDVSSRVGEGSAFTVSVPRSLSKTSASS
jgi:signal transduction histidine kinase